jgi:hypothetical protein
MSSISLVWVWILVSEVKGGTWTEGLEENMWMEKAA